MPEGRGQEDGKGLIESDSPKGKSAKANYLEAKSSKTVWPASTGNRTRKSLIESETQDSKTKKHEGKRPE
ncbi:hypothetical protein, partial [Streptomyces cyaneofuscatus]|uniref:hypothetical protein n=1 Tax=Streptomyces cyaneofuscatus TaxID=66883 RepID=UPI0037F8D089